MIELELEPELGRRVRADAQAHGSDISEYIGKQLAFWLPLMAATKTPAEIKQAVQQMLDRRIKLQPGETIKAFIEEGRRY